MQFVNEKYIQNILDQTVDEARLIESGEVAQYIPELSSVNPNITCAAIRTLNGNLLTSGDDPNQKFSIQSVSKIVILVGLLEEFGPQAVYEWVFVEPSGGDFASVSRFDQMKPSNPMINSGAIALCSHIPGKAEEAIHWLEIWMERLFGEKLMINAKVFASERRTGDRNRALAYQLKSNGMLIGDVEGILETYFASCSFEASVIQASYLPFLLANRGKNPNGEKVISDRTVADVVSIMATCGLYNESGTHLVKTGLPAKSGISGYLVASALGVAGIATMSPRVNEKGTSVRGAYILEKLSKALNWHFTLIKNE